MFDDYMAEQISVSKSSNKAARYEELIPQIQALIKDEADLVANLANICGALKEAMEFFWVGFYLVKGDELVLGPFQGPVACTRIQKGKGVCGTAWEQGKTIIVPDVHQFSGHIVCNAAAKSEIVLPAFKQGRVFLVLDVDSDKVNDFDPTDEEGLQRIIQLVEKL